MCNESEEVRAQQQADAAWTQEVYAGLNAIFTSAQNRPAGHRAFVAGLMERYARILLESAYADVE